MTTSPPTSSEPSVRQVPASCSTRPQPEADRAALIGRLAERADGEWLAELLIDLEEDEPARLHMVEALRRALMPLR
jgi:hypothetical protein